MSVIVIQFITLDGVVSDPDGSGGTPAGGWAFRHGPETVAGDKFRLGETLDNGVMLLGRTTWQLFSKLWPGRDSPFAARMNAVPKLVATATLGDTSAWANSRVLDGDLADAVRREPRDIIITGSLSIVRALMAQDLIDEYRLLTFPTILGTGERLFPAGGPPSYLESLSAEQAGAAVLTRYRRAARRRPGSSHSTRGRPTRRSSTGTTARSTFRSRAGCRACAGMRSAGTSPPSAAARLITSWLSWTGPRRTNCARRSPQPRAAPPRPTPPGSRSLPRSAA